MNAQFITQAFSEIASGNIKFKKEVIDTCVWAGLKILSHIDGQREWEYGDEERCRFERWIQTNIWMRGSRKNTRPTRRRPIDGMVPRHNAVVCRLNRLFYIRFRDMATQTSYDMLTMTTKIHSPCIINYPNGVHRECSLWNIACKQYELNTV